MSQGILDFIWISVLTLIMLVLIGRMLVSYFIRAVKYGGIPPSSESREKMKFVTQLTKAEVIEGLRSHKVNDIFEYEFRSESDMVYILSIKGIGRLNLACEGNVTYKLVITSKADNTVVCFI